MPTRILISEKSLGAEIDALTRDFDVVHAPELGANPEALRARIAEGFDAILVRNITRVDAALFAAAGPRLKIVGRLGVGLETIDVAAASAAGVVVAFAPEQNAVSVAELTLGLMLALARSIPLADRDTKGGGWDRQRFTGVELYGKTLGLVGLGRIGFRVGTRAKAFGMTVIAHDAYAHPDALVVAELGARLVSLDELLGSADFVSCHMPDTPATRGMFGYERFCQMKPSAFFLNTARGTAVDEAGLVRALQEKRLAGAGLDVRQKEPPGAGDPFAGMDNVILTPHIAAFTEEGQQRVLSTVCADVRAVLNGGDAKNVANFSRPRPPANA